MRKQWHKFCDYALEVVGVKVNRGQFDMSRRFDNALFGILAIGAMFLSLSGLGLPAALVSAALVGVLVAWSI